jgi:hypothetical protein
MLIRMPPARIRVTPSPIAELMADLGHVPRLPAAACRGRAKLFDATIPDVSNRPRAAVARREALKVCAACSCLRACSAWLDSLDPADRPRGVVAGRINTWREERWD